MQTIDIKDIQGIVLKGYGSMINVRYCLLKIEDAKRAKIWLDEIVSKISDGDHSPEMASLNIAFTFHGLKALGLKDANLRNFGREFREGMATPHRQRILGDFDTSAPTEWRWGGFARDGKSEENLHILLMVFGKNIEVLNEFYTELEGQFLSKGISIIENLDGQINKDSKEHFGFRDGIAQPVIAGSGQTGEANNVVAPGEFILGYKNQYGVYPETPLIEIEQGDLNLLSDDECGSSLKNIGRNGSYLVFRQMEQHVDRFWKFINENSKNEKGELNDAESIKLASKMVGRWPSGAPLVAFPEEDPGKLSDMDNFGYSENDKQGLRCPFGSHIRRTNPRDAFEDNKAKLSSKLTNKHRIIRRGRSYGEAIDAGPNNYKTKDEVGLHFICVNANIENQFEFIQRTWSNNPSFQNLYNEPDPLTGTQENIDKSLTQNFTVQDYPTNRCIQNLPQFVTIRGGAYFFLPSMSAIKYLATI